MAFGTCTSPVFQAGELMPGCAQAGQVCQAVPTGRAKPTSHTRLFTESLFTELHSYCIVFIQCM